MGLFFRRLFWFILVVLSGLVVALLGASQYGIIVDLNALARLSGLHEVAGVTEIINEIPTILNYSIVKAYGFYGSLALFLILLLIFKISLGSRRSEEIEVARARDTEVAAKTQTQTVVETDSSPESFDQTFDGRSTATEFIAETNSDAVVGTDGEIYDGTATFSGTDTYGGIGTRPDFDSDAESDEYDALSDSLAETKVAEADENETGLSYLTDAELKSKTLNLAEEMRFFESDYQSNRDETASEFTESVSDEGLREVLQNVKDSYEQKQSDYSSDFKSKYEPEAITVRHEISKRLGISKPSENFNPALDHGVLVGANPVADAADLIEELVRKLA